LSLRWRLTLYYAAISAGLLLLGSVILFLVLRSTLQQTLDDSLREAVAIAASQLGSDEAKVRESTDVFLTRLPGATVLLVYDAKGNLTDRFGTPPVQTALQPGFVTVQGTRVYSEFLSDGGLIQAMRSEVETSRTIGRTQKLLLLSLPLLLLAGLAAGYVVADRALRPVDSVTRLASKIAESGRFMERVPESPGKDEMAHLTQTFNAMLWRLENTIEREKAFALAAAHELRTPLTILQGRASLSLERSRTPEQYQEALKLVENTSHELVRVVESLLMLARSNQPPAMQTVHLDFLALEASEAQQLLARERMTRVNLELEPASASGDPTALRTAIANLIINALKYGRERGQVWVRTHRDMARAVVEIADDGPGVPEAELARLRQPFQRGSGLQAVSGAGLGLALVSAIAEQHGGRLELGRAAEGGLLARLELP